jgi:predicted HTH domain antitoxin
MPRLIDVAEGRATLLPYGLSPARLKATPKPAKLKRAKRHFPPVKISLREMREIVAAYGPFLSLEKAAEIAGLAPMTLKKQVSQGRYKNCAKRGKPIRFLTERFVQELFGELRP